VSAPAFADLFRATRCEVDAVLGKVPDSLLEARRLITREMQFEPRPEELQAIVKIAGFTSTSIVCYEFPRQMLALRVLAERELAGYLGGRRLHAEKLERTGAMIEELLAVGEQAKADLTMNAESMALVSDEERRFLQYVLDVVALPKAKLEAAAVLAPRLEFVAKLVATGNIAETFPGLNDQEIEMFNHAVHLDEDDPAGPARVCLEAVALRTILDEYISVWGRSDYLEDAELIDQLQQSIREQLLEAETAYRVVNENLQIQQDEAIAASLDDFAKELRTAKSRLFDTYIKTQPLVRRPEAVAFEPGSPKKSLAETLAEAETADENAVSHKQRSDELYLNALTSLRQDRAAGRDMSLHPLAVAKRRYKRKLWMMAASIGVLAVVAVAVHWVLPAPIPKPPKVSLKEFQPSLGVMDAKPIGSMLYVRVADWENLSVESTRFQAAEIGGLASEKGLSMAYIVSVSGEELAEWHTNGGVLVKNRAAAEDVISLAQERARAAREAAASDN